jgi:hypothetical protein
MKFNDVVLFVAFLTSLAFIWGVVDGTIPAYKAEKGNVKECGK